MYFLWPQTTGNFYASYTQPRGQLKGWGVGFGGNYASKSYIVNSTATGQFYLCAYLLFNAGVFYDSPHYRLSINADNLGNNCYYTGNSGVFTPGMLRRINAGITVKL